MLDYEKSYPCALLTHPSVFMSCSYIELAVRAFHVCLQTWTTSAERRLERNREGEKWCKREDPRRASTPTDYFRTSLSPSSTPSFLFTFVLPELEIAITFSCVLWEHLSLLITLCHVWCHVLLERSFSVWTILVWCRHYDTLKLHKNVRIELLSDISSFLCLEPIPFSFHWCCGDEGLSYGCLTALCNESLLLLYWCFSYFVLFSFHSYCLITFCRRVAGDQFSSK